MLQLKQLFNFYINSSIHVALSVFALVQITGLQFQITDLEDCAFFAFFGAIAAYNFVKYYNFIRVQGWQMSNRLKGIVLLSVLSLLVAFFYFFKLTKEAQISALITLVLTLSYKLPFFPNRKSARSSPGMKIYMVALCWVGATVVLPVINSEIPITLDFYLKCVQRFVLVFALTLIFEIIDLKTDNLNLKTVPQQIGVKMTKWLGIILLLIFCGLEFFNVNNNINSNSNINVHYFLLRLIIAIAIAIFLLFANENRSRNYAAFWAESVPVFWWFLFLIMK
ncbi:MAG: hypothetical protein ACI7YS_13015 [Flavobacterium sp.]